MVVAVVVVAVVIPLGVVWVAEVLGEVGRGSCSVMTDHYDDDGNDEDEDDDDD